MLTAKTGPLADVSIHHIGRYKKTMYAPRMKRFFSLIMFVVFAGCTPEQEQVSETELFETCFSKNTFFAKNEHPDQKYAGIVTAYIGQGGQLDLKYPPYLRSPHCTNVRVKVDLDKIKERTEILGKAEINKGNDRLFCSGDVCGLRNFELSMVFVGNGIFSIAKTGELLFNVTSVKQFVPEDATQRLFSQEELETYVRVKQGEMRVVNPSYCTIDCTE